jgi:hypothetical protein
MARPNVLDEPILAALRDAGTVGVLAPDLIARISGTGSARGVQFALARLLEKGQAARQFEWTFFDNGKPRARVYRYFIREFAPA